MGKQLNNAQYQIQNADYTACHIPNSVKKYKVFEAAKPALTFVLTARGTWWRSRSSFWDRSSTSFGRSSSSSYTVDAIKIGQEVFLGRRTNMNMQTSPSRS